MKIYLDLVFFLNLLFDFLLLFVVKIVLKKRVKWYRILLGSLVGALSISFLFMELTSFLLFVFKVIIAFFMIGITFGFKDKKMFFRELLYLYFISIILGGFMYYLNLEFSYQNIGLVFFHNGFSINFILLIILSPLILYLYVKQDRKLKEIENYYYQIQLFYQGSSWEYYAYLDTGNKLYDPYFHRPIILLYDSNFIPVDNPIYVPYHTLEHTGLLECFKADKMVLDNNKVISKPFVAISREPFKMEDIQVLLHKDYLE